MTNCSQTSTHQVWGERVERFLHSGQTVAEFWAAECGPIALAVEISILLERLGAADEATLRAVEIAASVAIRR